MHWIGSTVQQHGLSCMDSVTAQPVLHRQHNNVSCIIGSTTERASELYNIEPLQITSANSVGSTVHQHQLHWINTMTTRVVLEKQHDNADCTESTAQQRGPESPATLNLCGSPAQTALAQQCNSMGCIRSTAQQCGLHSANNTRA